MSKAGCIGLGIMGAPMALHQKDPGLALPGARERMAGHEVA